MLTKEMIVRLHDCCFCRLTLGLAPAADQAGCVLRCPDRVGVREADG